MYADRDEAGHAAVAIAARTPTEKVERWLQTHGSASVAARDKGLASMVERALSDAGMHMSVKGKVLGRKKTTAHIEALLRADRVEPVP